MGKQSKAARKARRALHLPEPAAPIQQWELNRKKSQVDAEHTAFFWRDTATSPHPLKREVTCDLCYRQCVLQPGEAGWCKIRSNRSGRMALEAHGVLGAMIKWHGGTFAIRPGVSWLYLAGTSCTSGCSFCTSTDLALHPDRLPWALGKENRGAMRGEFAYHRAILHPESAISMAQEWGVDQIYLGGNEATLTFEWTYDVARLAKEAGLFVRMDTNGYTSPAAIEALAPYVDAVFVGTKGCAAEHFYAKYTRSPGAAKAVREALRTWKATGTFVTVADVIAPPHWVDDDTFYEDANAFYAWIAEELGPLTPVEIRTMIRPPKLYSVEGEGEGFQPLLPRNATAPDKIMFFQRIEDVTEIARSHGLHYAYSTNADTVYCHACRSPLVENINWSDIDAIRCNVTDGRCDRCREEVPIIAPAVTTLAKAA